MLLEMIYYYTKSQMSKKKSEMNTLTIKLDGVREILENKKYNRPFLKKSKFQLFDLHKPLL